MAAGMSLRALFAAAALAAFSALQAAPPLFHDHGHGLSFSPDGRRLLAPAERGLAAYEDGGWHEPSSDQGDFLAFAVAAGYGTGALYVLNPKQNSAMGSPGIYVTHDDGRSWRRVAAQGLGGEIHGLAAHPRERAIVAAATESSLYLSRDAGDSFRRLDGPRTATAVAFDARGGRLRYAFALSGELMEIALDGWRRVAVDEALHREEEEQGE